MTDSTQTVSVPVDLLKNLKERYPLNARDVDGPIKALADLIPTSYKVGDVLTAVQVYDLPVRSTFVDEDDDVYVVTAEREIYRVTNVYGVGFQTNEEMFESDAPNSDYNGLRVTFIPKPRD